MVGRVPLTSGKLFHEGRDVTHLSKREWRRLRRDIQLIFQDPYASLNPRMRVREIIAEPLVVHHMRGAPSSTAGWTSSSTWSACPAARRSATRTRSPAGSGSGSSSHAPSRSILRFIVADEPVSALDVSIQAQIVGLLQDLQRELGLSYLFIAHNLAVVRHIADRVAVMYLGRLVEVADKDTLYKDALHPYTRALLSAVPIPDPTIERLGRIILTGDVPSPMAPPKGCRFNTRVRVRGGRCYRDAPPLTEVVPGHRVACWVAVADPTRVKEPPNDDRARPALHRRAAAYGLLMSGRAVAGSGPTVEVRSRLDGSLLAELATAGPDDVRAAYAAASRAVPALGGHNPAGAARPRCTAPRRLFRGAGRPAGRGHHRGDGQAPGRGAPRSRRVPPSSTTTPRSATGRWARPSAPTPTRTCSRSSSPWARSRSLRRGTSRSRSRCASSPARLAAGNAVLFKPSMNPRCAGW